ncbi:uncharacterized protein MEPE_01607 [Melanopsichium pennsylvanicum]|uniref:Uncharacterized protein n=2 Tax=Melanopsichium pennsylvanicum TaxID=63383 RepID=A0AAJ4XJK5_9BASI|nr:hypothetical protein BN887_06079 [Melanopsichium pennsylvanicum 4]SNX82901.1 uncharacterized protein MEPE_01607 [Melanopsichium pennsylvanicum]
MANGHDQAFDAPLSPHPPSPKASASFLNTLNKVQSILARTSHDESLLRDEAWPSLLKRIYGALDTGKPITGAGPNRGLPMSTMVLTLKAAWHIDGTWPIGANALQQLEEHSKFNMARDKGPVGKQDPSPEDVAKAYKKRGVIVEGVQVVQDDW